jgi:hypothetical protein
MPASRLHDVPIALGSDGSLILNLASAFATRDLAAVIRKARRDGRPLFVGVVLSANEHRDAVRRLDNASAETAARLSASAPKARAPRVAAGRAKRPAARRRSP